MKFVNEEAENYYRDLVNKFGYIHINTGGKEISVECLMDLRGCLQNSLEKIKKEKEEKEV